MYFHAAEINKGKHMYHTCQVCGGNITWNSNACFSKPLFVIFEGKNSMVANANKLSRTSETGMTYFVVIVNGCYPLTTQCVFLALDQHLRLDDPVKVIASVYLS